jgi:hypothetical protein
MRIFRHRFDVKAPYQSVIEFHYLGSSMGANWFWEAIGFGMWLTLPMMFVYRGWKTRKLVH